jgi:hypothetical protein
MQLLCVACGADDVAADDLSALDAALAERSRPVVVVVDGLDEAAEAGPVPLLERLLGELARFGRNSRLRLLIGTRRRDAGTFVPGTEQADLDSPVYAEPDAVRRYAEALLRQAGAARPASGALAVARVARGSFRLAELLCRDALPASDVLPRLWSAWWSPSSVASAWLRLVRVSVTGSAAVLAVTADGDGSVLVRDASTGAVVGGPRRPQGPAAAVSVAVAADRVLLVTAGTDGTVRVWDPVTETGIAQVSAGLVSAVSAAMVSGRLLLVSGGDDGLVRLWDPASGALVGESPVGHAGAVTAVSMAEVAGRGVVASGDGDGLVRLWDPASGEDVEVLRPGRAAAVSALRVSAPPMADGSGRPVVLAGGQGGSVRCWSVSGVRPPAVIAGRVHDFTVIDGGRILVVTDAGILLLRMPAAGGEA